MLIVIDTNVLLSSIGTRAPYRWLWDAVMDGRCAMVVTTDVLLEYEEILSIRANTIVAQNILQAITRLPQIHKTTVYYRWNLIASDVDDNKFVDCAISGNAEYIISNDRHFEILQDIDFPSVVAIRPETFRLILSENS